MILAAWETEGMCETSLSKRGFWCNVCRLISHWSRLKVNVATEIPHKLHQYLASIDCTIKNLWTQNHNVFVLNVVVCLIINIVIYAIISLLLKYNLEKKGWTSYNVAYLNARNSYTTVLKQYHKFGVGRNHGDNMAPSFLKFSSQNRFF